MLILMYMFVSINSNNSILGPENIGIDAKVDILLQILIRLPGIYQIVQAVILFSLINNFYFL